MSKKTAAAAPSPIADAASALAAALRRFDEQAAAARGIAMNSEKALARATRGVNDALESQRAVAERVRDLVAAISEAQSKQQKSAEELEAHVRVIETRRAEFDAMLRRFAELGQEAQVIAGMVQEIAGPEPTTPDERRAAAEKVHALEQRMDEAAGKARELAKAAHEQQMIDLHREADALSQRIAAARDKLSKVGRALSQAAEPPAKE